MKTIIAGSRSITHLEVVIEAMRQVPWASEISEVVSGGARGVDALGELWAKGQGVPVKRFPVTQGDYDLHGKRAPLLRNTKMAQYADALVAIWDGESRGTQDMIRKAEAQGLQVKVLPPIKGRMGICPKCRKKSVYRVYPVQSGEEWCYPCIERARESARHGRFDRSCLRVGDLREALSGYPDDAVVVFPAQGHGRPHETELTPVGRVDSLNVIQNEGKLYEHHIDEDALSLATPAVLLSGEG